MGTMSTIRPFFTVISRRTGSRITEGDTTGDGLVAIESCCPDSPPAKTGGGWLQRTITCAPEPPAGNFIPGRHATCISGSFGLASRGALARQPSFRRAKTAPNAVRLRRYASRVDPSSLIETISSLQSPFFCGSENAGTWKQNKKIKLKHRLSAQDGAEEKIQRKIC